MTNTPAQAGLIISKSVGGSVARHRVARQIRHVLKEHLIALPAGTHVVVRALAGSAGQDLKKDLNALIPKAIEKVVALK
jgi:ribonuclease P protein component